jgi:hypothetical protein
MSAHTSVSVMRARELRDAGWTYQRIAELLSEELGRTVHRRTINIWCSDSHAENHRAWDRSYRQGLRAQSATFRLPGTSDEYRANCARALHAEGVLIPSIARVFRVLFPDQPWSRERVETLLNRERVAA